MAQFEIVAVSTKTGAPAIFTYDNMTSELLDAEGVRIGNIAENSNKSWRGTSVDSPTVGKGNIRRLKIQLGLSCNYECSYCSQRYVPRAEETNRDDVQPFIDGLPSWFDGGTDGLGSGVRIEFWGGEPFVYWKTLRPLAEALRGRYPKAQLFLITNGSLLDVEKNAWLDAQRFVVSISHDGPGYHVRGADPFDDPDKFAVIKDLYNRLGPDRMSFNAMMHVDNASRAEITEWMTARLGADVRIGEGSYVDAYDEGGLASSMPDVEWARAYAQRAYVEMRAGMARNMSITSAKVAEFVQSVLSGRRAETLGQKCGMDSHQNIAVDLRGNVLTCQNVSAASTAPNGRAHKIGHVSDLATVKLGTSTHWSKRPDCSNCPVLQLCKGSCMFLEGERWDASCLGSYFDNVAFFAGGIEFLTGHIPVSVTGPHPQERHDIFGLLSAPAKPVSRKVIPIVPATTR